MSKQQKKHKQAPQSQRPQAQPPKPRPVAPEKKTVAPQVPKPFRIPYPVLVLIALTLILYFSSFYFGFTELDDSAFIREQPDYFSNLSNLVVSFQRGVFNAFNDTYYRPLFLDSIILNYQIGGAEIFSYHVVNVLLHITSVVLLYQLFRKLHISELQSFLLAALFAVHPVLSQAVVWIPGRNDTLLAAFTFAFFITSISYADTGKIKWLVISAIMLLGAFFTKETAVFDAPVAFVLLVVFLKKNWKDKRNIVQYCVWAAMFGVWYFVRSRAAISTAKISGPQIAHDFVNRFPVLIQYFGKIFLPFNLNVFPIKEDTVYYWGLIALAIAIVIVLLAKDKQWSKIWGGAAIFFLFLLPVLIVPSTLNEQNFEHRLYLPIIGILLILPQTILLKNRLKPKQLAIAWGVLILFFGILNFRHQRYFKDPVIFWHEAYVGSPHSAYATMMYAARITDKKLMRKAYEMDPHQKYVNYYLGRILQSEDSIMASEKYFIEERKISDFYGCDYYIARVEAEKKNFKNAAFYLERYLSIDSADKMANNNLLFTYYNLQEKAKARLVVERMRRMGLPVGKDILRWLQM